MFRRRLKENFTSLMSVTLISIVVLYKMFLAEKLNHFPRIRRGIAIKSTNASTPSLAYCQKSFVQIWRPSPFWKMVYSVPVHRKYEARKKLLVESCGNSQYEKGWRDNIQLISAPKRGLVVCYVQKAGSTSWHKLVYNLRHSERDWASSGHMENRIFTKNLDQKVKNYLTTSPDATRVVVVRHPFARLVSGWNNKFHKKFISRAGNVMTKTMPEIVNYFKRISPFDPHHEISFRDFMQFIVDKGLQNVDNHFKSIVQLCEPCKFPYNIIVKTETAPEDLWWVLDRVNGSMTSFPVHSVPEYDGVDRRMANYKMRTGLESLKNPNYQINQDFIIETIREKFQNVPKGVVKKLMKLYQHDFTYFGYTFDIATLTAGGMS